MQISQKIISVFFSTGMTVKGRQSFCQHSLQHAQRHPVTIIRKSVLSLRCDPRGGVHVRVRRPRLLINGESRPRRAHLVTPPPPPRRHKWMLTIQSAPRAPLSDEEKRIKALSDTARARAHPSLSAIVQVISVRFPSFDVRRQGAQIADTCTLGESGVIRMGSPV